MKLKLVLVVMITMKVDMVKVVRPDEGDDYDEGRYGHGGVN
jgi:hypothetical protein